MPSNVSTYEKLSYGSLLIGLLIMLFDGQRIAAMPEIRNGGGMGMLIAIMLVSFAVIILLVWLSARRRKNWARWLMLLFFIPGAVMSAPQIAQTLQISPVAGVLNIVQSIMQLVAIIFVFTGNANPYFRKASEIAETIAVRGQS
jgi:hypothetical protein